MIGGFRTGLEKNGHECIAFCEIDKYARQSYKAIYDTEGEEEWHDITQVSNEEFRAFRGRADIITGGFPCQAFSIAGNRRGFEDTRGTLFFEIARAIKEIQPSYALLENVKGLFSHDKGRTFGTIIQALDELGYVVEWGLFNSKFWGVPQNRERVFILVTRKDVFKGSKLFDLLKQQTEVNTRLVDVLEDEVDEKFYLSEEKTSKLILNTMQDGDVQPKVAVLGNTSNTGHRSHDIHDIEGISPTIAARDYKGAKQIAYLYDVGDIYTNDSKEFNRGPLKGLSRTLKANNHDAGVTDGLRIRKLTPLECWRLQGFTDDQFYKAKNAGVSNSQLYKQVGNSVTVNVIDAIAKLF